MPKLLPVSLLLLALQMVQAASQDTHVESAARTLAGRFNSSIADEGGIILTQTKDRTGKDELDQEDEPVSLSSHCRGNCSVSVGGEDGCHKWDGQQVCSKHYTFAGPAADTCEYNSGVQQSICSFLWHMTGVTKPCKDPATDCPVKLAGQPCSLIPSGGGEWCIGGTEGSVCLLNQTQAKTCRASRSS
jgi:hypothetical protein